MRFQETLFCTGDWADAYQVEYSEINVISCDGYDVAQKYIWALTGETKNAHTLAYDYRPRDILTIHPRLDLFNLYATNKGEFEKFIANHVGLGIVLMPFPEAYTPFEKVDELIRLIVDAQSKGIQTFVFTKDYLLWKSLDIATTPYYAKFISLARSNSGAIAVYTDRSVFERLDPMLKAWSNVLDRAYDVATGMEKERNGD